jgi:hypothetical protein
MATPEWDKPTVYTKPSNASIGQANLLHQGIQSLNGKNQPLTTRHPMLQWDKPTSYTKDANALKGQANQGLLY